MKTYLMADSVRYRSMSARELRGTFLLDTLDAAGEIRLAYLETDRAVVGMACPVNSALALPCDAELRAQYFLERREVGALNIGGPGRINVDGQSFELNNIDCLYIGRGNKSVQFQSRDAGNPAIFYLLSYPAHAEYPVTLVRKEEATPTELGSGENANSRAVCKYIHMQGARSCQVVMGVTHLREGSVWNTMPPHTHLRRSEIYMYFNLGDNDRVFHLMGVPDETRHLVLGNRDVAVSPPWSIHCGAGTHAYSFCWGMGGENQDYADMDALRIGDLL
ncbi:MAG TPA: 5-dehydro-4-deoxy-D-glucuronate isomerase [Terracidiphilus sp.]